MYSYCMLLILCSIQTGLVSTYGVYSSSNSASGQEYSADVVVGASLFDDGLIQGYTDNNYHVTLLVTDGLFSSHTIYNSFFLGYQWYNKPKITSGTVKIQLYQRDHLESNNYTLMAETDWLTSNPGFNTYYFDKAVMINSATNTGYTNYIMAVMADRNAVIPVLYDECAAETRQVYKASLSSEAALGEVVTFNDHNSAGDACTTLAIQAIFDHSAFAVAGSICEMTVADSRTLSSTDMATECLIVRGATALNGVTVKPHNFLLTYSEACSTHSLRMEELKNVTTKDIWGTYCGTSIFKSFFSATNYMKFRLSLPSTDDRSTQYFTLQLESGELRDEGSAVTIALGGCAGVTFVIHVLWLVVFNPKYIVYINKRKEKVKQRHRQRQSAARPAANQPAATRPAASTSSNNSPQTPTPTPKPTPNPAPQNPSPRGNQVSDVAPISVAPSAPSRPPTAGAVPPVQPWPGQSFSPPPSYDMVQEMDRLNNQEAQPPPPVYVQPNNQ